MQKQNTETTPQRPDIGIETVKQAGEVTVTDNEFPWISAENFEVPLVQVETVEGVRFQYGSLVGANNAATKIASKTPEPLSKGAEAGFFKCIGPMLSQETPANVDYVPLDSPTPIYKVGKKGKDAARLFFTIFESEDGDPIVLKLGVASHKKQQELMSVLRSSSKVRKGKKA